MKSCTSFVGVIATIGFLLLSFVPRVSHAFSAQRLKKEHSTNTASSLQSLASDDLREEFARKKEAMMMNKKTDDDNFITIVMDGILGGVLKDLTGMWNQLDDVVDDFVYKRMGAGEQWYGKRKYNPSGKHDGAYNGMGRSDYVQIEIARALREEMEMRKEQRLSSNNEQDKHSF